MRDPASHDYHYTLLNGVLGFEHSTTYGVNGPSPLSLIDYFFIANFQIPRDIMHVLFEGVLPLEVNLMLPSFMESGLFTLDFLNNRVSHFTYGRAEAKNKPPKPFQKSYFTGTAHKLHLSGIFFSCTVYCFTFQAYLHRCGTLRYCCRS